MSILKIRTNEPHTTPVAEEVLGEFNIILDYYTDVSDVDNKVGDVKDLINQYSIYSYLYLSKVAHTFKNDVAMKDTLTFMNSVIAEVLHDQEIAYFHPEEGYSIVDKAVSYMVEFGSDGLVEYLDTVIEDMKPVVVETEEESNASWDAVGDGSEGTESEEEFEEEQEEG